MSEEKEEGLGDEQPDNRKRNIIIVVCVMAVILALGIPILVLRGDKDNSLTPLEVVQEQVGALESQVGALEGKVASHAEDIVDIESDVDGLSAPVDWGSAIDNLEDDIEALQGEIDGLPDWVSNITALEGNVMTLQNTITGLPDWESSITGLIDTIAELDGRIAALEAEITSRSYVVVSDISGDEVEITVYGSGDFPVVVTCYGSGLLVGEIDVAGTNCEIEQELRYAAGKILALFIGTDGEWVATDTITLSVDGLTLGTIDYVTASIGGA